MTKGILIYALGHENYYRMAEVLAASLIANGSRAADIGIAVVCDDPGKIIYPHLFTDQIILAKDKFTVHGKVVFNHATVMVYDLSPFDITIKLDADMVWIDDRKPADLFAELEAHDITFSNRGHGWGQGNSVWAEEAALITAYKLTGNEKLYKIYGEFLYFKKTPANQKYFKAVRDIYSRKKVKSAAFANGSFTDELAFQIACMQQEVYPHQDNFTPIYNQFLGYGELRRKYPYQLAGYYGYSIGGNMTDAFTKANYDTLAKHYFHKLGLSNPYQVSNKRSFLPERKTL
ncbi:hypothetical protein JMG10_07605 [Nostoc ellipsosporum NOK]|nr:hypothetical protein [Nostoc ellipsosporum NOK]